MSNKKGINTVVDLGVFADEFFTEVDTTAKEPLPPKSTFDTKKVSKTTVIVEEGTKLVKYSKLFGWDDKTLDGMEDFDVVTYTDKYWPKDELELVPELSKFDGRVIDHTAVYPFVMGMQPQFKGFKILLVGPTGSGKTTLAEHYCASINQPFLRINGRQDMESDTILGKPWVNPQGFMDWLTGEWPKATARGHFVLIDEPWKIPSGIWMTASRHLERGGIWQIDDMPGDTVQDKQVLPANSYRCVLADNVVGTGDNIEQYGATMIQDSSTLNRIDMVIKVPYLKPKDEANVIVGKFPAIPKHVATKMISLLNLLRTGFDKGELSSPASLRNIEAWCEMSVQLQGNYGKAFSWVMHNRYADAAEGGAVKNHYFTCLGTQMESSNV